MTARGDDEQSAPAAPCRRWRRWLLVLMLIPVVYVTSFVLLLRYHQAMFYIAGTPGPKPIHVGITTNRPLGELLGYFWWPLVRFGESRCWFRYDTEIPPDQPWLVYMLVADLLR